MGTCQVKKDIEALKVPRSEGVARSFHGERFIGHNLAIDKALEAFGDECPHLTRILYTGWYVLVRKREDGSWEPVRCVKDCDPDWDSGEEKWDLILPIPDPESAMEVYGEWDGF